jgi:hypothetical protein
VLLRFTHCIYDADVFAIANQTLPRGPTPIALYEAMTCPEALGVSETDYESLVKGKIAIGLRSVPRHHDLSHFRLP